MDDLRILQIFLAVFFVLAPLMTHFFSLQGSTVFSDAYKSILIILLIGASLNIKELALVWPLFCIFGFILYFRSLYVETNAKNSTTENVVIFFDGFCVLCSRTVALLLKLDHKRIFRFSSLQGKYAHEVLDSRQIEKGASVVLYHNGHSYERAEAVMQILFRLGGIYKFLARVLCLFPLYLLNVLYYLIAHNRYRIFGKNSSCLVPNEKERMLFIP